MRLRIATFNVESLGEPRGGGASLEERVQVLRPQLVRLRADILCLQEVDAQHEGRGRHRRLAALEALIEGTPYAACTPITTTSRSKGGPRDKHNLVILSCLKIALHRQILHDYVSPPQFRRSHDTVGEAEDGGEPDMAIEWDRPFLYALVTLPDGRRLHLINVHLRAPRAAFMPGGKGSSGTWRTMAGWAEGFFVAAVKRAGQALEVRLLIDKLFDEDPEALIAVCGDFNAAGYEIPLRT
ncbi:MAG: endonuclease/exonuclease/phosphatase family protein, partial [Rhodospirillales bacterium]